MKHNKILTNAGVPFFKLRRLHRFGLTDSIQCVSGVGQATYLKIRQDLDEDNTITRVPEEQRWLYGLALDILGVERSATLLVQKQPSGSCLLDEMQDINRDAYEHCMQAFSTLPRRDRNILTDYYRGSLQIANIAQKHRCSQSDVMDSIRRTISYIRNSKNLSTPLFQTVFRDGSERPEGVRDIRDFVKPLR